jgi:hypothetical protein
MPKEKGAGVARPPDPGSKSRERSFTLKLTPVRAPGERPSRNFFRLVLAISIVGLAKVALQVSMPWRRRR